MILIRWRCLEKTSFVSTAKRREKSVLSFPSSDNTQLLSVTNAPLLTTLTTRMKDADMNYELFPFRHHQPLSFSSEA